MKLIHSTPSVSSWAAVASEPREATAPAANGMCSPATLFCLRKHPGLGPHGIRGEAHDNLCNLPGKSGKPHETPPLLPCETVQRPMQRAPLVLSCCLILSTVAIAYSPAPSPYSEPRSSQKYLRGENAQYMAMHMCMYILVSTFVCVYTYRYTHMCIHVHIYIHIRCMYMYTHTHSYQRLCVDIVIKHMFSMRVYPYAAAKVYIHVYIYIYLYVYPYLYVYLSICRYMYIYLYLYLYGAYTYTHTYT